MIELETDRLLIRSFRVSDAEPLREIILGKEASEYAIYDHPWPTSLEEIRKIAEWFAGRDNFLAVCLKETGVLIGFITLHRTGENTRVTADLGYCIDSRHQRNGYATEGCNAVLEYAFRQLGVDRVTANTALKNGPSCELLARLGMRKIGESEHSFRKAPDGQPILFMGGAFEVTRDEWVPRFFSSAQ